MLANAALALAVFVVLAVSPAPVHFPSTHWEALLLTIGAFALLVANGVTAAIAAASAVQRGRAAADESPTLRSMREYEHFVATNDDGVIGVVDEVIAGRDGEPAGLIVSDGWFGVRRSFVPLDDIRGVSGEQREVQIVDDPSFRSARVPAGR